MCNTPLCWASLLLFCACNSDPVIHDQHAPPTDGGVDTASPDDLTGWAEEANWADHVPNAADDPDASELPFDPWSLNVVLGGDLGSEEDPYQSDFQGAAAVLGETWLAYFSLNDVCEEMVPYALFAGDTVHVTGAINNGGIEAAGAISLAGASVAGSVMGGGDLLEGSGSISGDLVLAGEDQAGLSVTVQGDTVEHCPYSPVLDLVALEGWFDQASASVAALEPSCAATEQWGELSIVVDAGINVVELEARDLEEAWGVTVRGPADAELYINLVGESLSLDGMVWSYLDGVQSETVLLNLPEVTDLDIVQGDHQVNMLAPSADVTFPSGLVTGNLVAASLSGGGQVNCGHFRGSVF